MRAWKRKAAHRRRQKKNETEFFSASEGRELKKQIDSSVRCIRQMDQEVEIAKNEYYEMKRKLEKIDKVSNYIDRAARWGLIITCLWEGFMVISYYARR